ncbi:transmembrane protein 79 [Mixophyes fleayi]|uniref:transmembrane protein 79 n=1 Tax=Mixophyes fleayi TaxID=3061075 RepID=UPI003F4DAE4F
MDARQQVLVNLDGSQDKAEGNGTGLVLKDTPEQKKKSRSVGFYELDILKSSNLAEATEDNKTVKSVDVKDETLSQKNKDMTNGFLDHPTDDPTCKNEDQSPNYFDQTSSSGCRKLSNPTCLCKDCVENYINLCEEVQEPINTDQENNGDVSLSTDRASLNSNKSMSGLETSRREDSSDDEFVGSRHEDTQVTLPYPDKGRPPDCITRLSNDGLYEPNQDSAGKRDDKYEREDKISQVAFFVEHVPLEELSRGTQNMGHSELVEIEKGDPETEPLVRMSRRPTDLESPHSGFCRCHGGCLKIVGSFVTAMIIFPAFLYGAYAWLPFDAPIMPDIPTRLVYTLRCAAFASFPIILGVIIHGISRLCVSSFDPFKPREREVTIHRRFVKQSTFLFVLYFFNLAVLATYLPRGQLKFIPLLTCLFSLSQLIYWLSSAVGRSFRGFGYGLTFLPLVAMMICNLYFMFVVEPEKMVFLGSRDVSQN